MPRARGMAAYVQMGVYFYVCSAWQNFYVFSQYHNPDLDNWVYECLLTSAAVLVPIYLWLEWRSTLRHSSLQMFWLWSAGDWSNSWKFGTFDFFMTDVPDQVQVTVVAPQGNSDHSSLSTAI